MVPSIESTTDTAGRAVDDIGDPVARNGDAVGSPRSPVSSFTSFTTSIDSPGQTTPLSAKSANATESQPSWLSPVNPTTKRRQSRPRTAGQMLVRIASLYAISVLLVVPVSLVLALTKQLLTPLFNSLPLTLHDIPFYAIITVFPVALYWYSTCAQGARETASARAFLIIAALGADVVVVSGRNVGSFLGSLLGPEWGALGARVILGGFTAGGSLAFALVCFDHISPVPAASTRAAKVESFLSVMVRAVGYMYHVYHGERLWSSILSSGSSFLVRRPENTILFISLLLTASSFFARSAQSASSIPFSRRAHLALTRSLHLSPTRSKRLAFLTTYLPHRVSPILLLLRLPLIVLAVRQQIFLRPLPPYVVPTGQLRVLSSERSISGQVVVAENLEIGYRFLRCDHSVLGGRWVRALNTTEGITTQLGESIFATFVIEEIGVLAHRLDANESLERTMSLTTELQVVPEEDEEQDDMDRPAERALIIGLGVGIAASTLSRRGMDLDIVELDPAVYSAATEYFNLSMSPTSSATIMDGAAYVQQAAELSREGEWDGQKWTYVIQDCFTGGSVPGELFTREFWTDLSELVEVDGIVAINLATTRDSKAARAALVTILSVFSQCRAFRDIAELGLRDHELSNLAVFCTMAHSPLLTFRPPGPSDLPRPRSSLREHVYTSFLTREVQLDAMIRPEDWDDEEMILRRGEAKMDAWQEGVSLATWYTMQQLLSKEMWLAW